MRHFTITVLAALVLCVAGLAASASPAAAQLYAADGGRASGMLYEINPLTGAASIVGAIQTSTGVGVPVGGMAFGPDDKLYAASTSGWSHSPAKTTLYTIDTETAVATPIGQIDNMANNAKGIGDVAFIGSTLYGFLKTDDGDCDYDLVTINTATGAVSCVGDSGLDSTSGGYGLAYDTTGTTLYGAAGGVDGDLSDLNTSDGSIDATLALDGAGGRWSDGESLAAMTYLDGTLYGVVRNWVDGGVYLVTINTGTGDVTVVGQLPALTDALAGK